MYVILKKIVLKLLYFCYIYQMQEYLKLHFDNGTLFLFIGLKKY